MPNGLEVISSPGRTGESSTLHWLPDIESIVRQPILGEFGARHGYELLFNTGRVDSPDASSNILRIVDHIVLFGLDRLTAKSPAFLPCTIDLLTEDLEDLLPASMTVLEIPVAVADSARLMTVCRHLQKAGFRFALLDFRDTPEAYRLLDLLHYVKIDTGRIGSREVAVARRRLKCCAAAMVATGIQSQASYREAHAEGFKYFQGLYFCRPEPVQNARVPADQLAHMQILRELLKEPLQLNTLCPLVKRDPPLVYRLLRQVNSAAYASREEIHTVEAAILMLGDVAFRRIASVAIGSALNAGRSPEILQTALVRARFCALSAPLANLDANDQYLLGLLSVLPGMLGVPMELIAPELPLRGKVSHALLGIPVYERCLLDWIECHESDHRSRCRAIAARHGLDESKLMQDYVGAIDPDPSELTLVA